MESVYKIYPDKKLVYFCIADNVTLHGMLSLVESIATDKEYRRSYNGVADFRKITKNLSPRDVVILATEVLTKNLSSGQWVILTDQHLTTAMAIMYQHTIGSHHSVSVRSTIEGASKRLQIDLHNIGIE